MARRFPIRFERAYGIVSSTLLIPPTSAYVDVGDTEVSVRMGWAFRTTFPRAHVAATSLHPDRIPLTRGVHGFAGRWLVNGAGDGVLTIDLSPAERAFVLGFPIRLRQLLVSVDEPNALAAALTR